MNNMWQQHKTRLRGYIAKRVSDDASVDDILQDVYLKAHTELSTLRSKGSVAGWLFRIASNAIADHYRSRRNWEELPDELAAPQPESDYAAELAVCLQPLIEDLPEIYRSALLLSEIEGLPQKQMAEQLGISLSGAKSRVQRGREKLRSRLLACCDIEMGRSGITGYEPRDGDCDCSCE